MRILITGVCGLIGNELAQQLSAQGHEIIGNDDLSHNCVTFKDLGASVTRTYTCLVSQLSYLLGNYEHLRPDLIIHCASPIGHALLTPEAEVAWRIVSDTQAVLDLAARIGARLITFSSSEVLTYRGETDIRAQYSLGKLTSEAMVLGHPTVDARVVRPYNVTGRLQRADGGFVMARFRDAVLRGEPLTVFGDGTQRRHFLHVYDFARFVCLLAEWWPERRVWSVANPSNGVAIGKLAQMFRRAVITAPNQIEVVWNSDAANVLNNATWRDTPERPIDVDGHYACMALGWKPQWSLENIVGEQLTTTIHTDRSTEPAIHD